MNRTAPSKVNIRVEGSVLDELGLDRQAASCIGLFDKLRAGSSARKERGPQDDR
jgi:hypothetical protein